MSTIVHLAAARQAQRTASHARHWGAMAPHDVAITRARKLSASRRRAALEPVVQARDAMLKGQGDFADWVTLCTAKHVLRALASNGVITGTHQYLDAAEQALNDIGNRAEQPGKWVPTALYFDELDALGVLDNLWRLALREASAGEMEDAEALAEQRVRCAQGTALNDKTLAELAKVGTKATGGAA